VVTRQERGCQGYSPQRCLDELRKKPRRFSGGDLMGPVGARKQEVLFGTSNRDIHETALLGDLMRGHFFHKLPSRGLHLFERLGAPPVKDRQRSFVPAEFIGQFALPEPAGGSLGCSGQLTLNQARDSHKIPLQTFCAVNGQNLHAPRFGLFGPGREVVFSFCLLQPLNKSGHAGVIGKGEIPRESLHKSVPCRS